MGAGNWIFYNSGKQKGWDGTIDFDTDTFKVALFTSASNCTTRTLSTYASLNNQIGTSGYPSGGKTLAGVALAAGTSGGIRKWSFTDKVITASGGPLTNVRYAVIYDSSATNVLVCYAALSTGQFTVTAGNTLTIGCGASGAFDISGATT